MKNKVLCLIFITVNFVQTTIFAQKNEAINPVIYADVPDMAMIRVGTNYYMSSTTMHLSPGLPIMKSTDLVNWKLLNYAYDTLATLPAFTLSDGKNAYGKGSLASIYQYSKC